MATINSINFYNSKSIPQVNSSYMQDKNQPLSSKNHEDEIMSAYLSNEAVLNSPVIKRVSFGEKQDNHYKNNLRTMINNNESVMLAIAPRTFTAKDLDGDEIITLSKGEKQGTFLSAVDRLDELKNDGFNTIHILPIHPTGKKKALGTAGSLYSPAKIVTDDGHLAIDPMLIDENDSRTPDEQFRAFIIECHKRNIKVMIDLPSCASVDLFEAEPELMAFGRNGEEKTPQGWTDIRMFDPWEDETKRTLNPKLLEMHKQFVDACIDLGIDGIRADVARAKPTEFWDILIPYSRQKDPEFAWLGETYTYECASPQINMPYDRPEDSLRAGFDEYYGQYHIFNEWKTSTEFTDYVIHNLALSKRLPAGKSCIGSFMTHDDKSAMIHGGANYCNMTTVLQSTIPMCNPYFVDGFQTGDYYNYGYSGKESDEYFIIPEKDINGDIVKPKMTTHKYQLDIFNLSRQPGGDHPDMERVLRETLNMRNNNKDLFADKNSSFIVLDKIGDKKDQIIAYARHNNGRTAVVVANKNPNRRLTGTVVVPGLKQNQKLINMAPKYGDTGEFQVSKNELRVDLPPCGAYVFEVETPNIEKDCRKSAYRQKVSD
ncbi:MAG: alpha amylase C-terminal domain-containing protein [bacterium]|nr:alpha amylase C-terminal domain-containing protein [bacterium]